MSTMAIVYLLLLATLILAAVWRREVIYVAMAFVGTLLILALVGIRV